MLYTKDRVIYEILARLYDRTYLEHGKDEKIEELLKMLERLIG